MVDRCLSPWAHTLPAVYCADVIELAKRHVINVHLYADDMQLYGHTSANQIVEQSVNRQADDLHYQHRSLECHRLA